MKRFTITAGIALSILMAGCWDMATPAQENLDAGPASGIGTSPQVAEPPTDDGIGTSPDGIGTSPEAKDPSCRDSAGRCNDDSSGTLPGDQ